MTGSVMSSATTGLKRVLIPTACSLRKSATLCYEDQLRGDDAGLQTAHVLANLTYHQQGAPVAFESREEPSHRGQSRFWLSPSPG